MRLGRCYRETDDRLGHSPAPELLSVSQYHGVTRRRELTDKPPRADSFERYKFCNPGDLVLNRFNAYRGALGVAKERGIVSPDYLVLRPVELGDGAYLNYLLRSDLIANTMKQGMGGIGATDPDSSGFSRIDVRHLGRHQLDYYPAPPIRGRLVTYLDHETAKIDALIGKQEQLVAALHEERTATITQAVTKGIDADPRLRESGVAWLGLVPATWEVQKLSRMFRAAKSPNAAQLTKEYCVDFPGDYPVYSGQTAEEGVLARVNFFEFDLGANGALLTTTVGAKAMSASHIHGRFNLSQNCMIITPSVALNMQFYFFHCQTLFAHERQFVSEHMQASFRMEDLYRFYIAVPPAEEQARIARYLQDRSSEVDRLIGKAKKAILLLREYRSALITAAVTGQIDVREAA